MLASPLSPHIDFSFETANWTPLTDDVPRYTRAIIEKVLPLFPVFICPTELSLVLMDDAEIQQLNAEFRHKNAPTNVLSFPQAKFRDGQLEDSLPPQGVPLLLGDIILSHTRLTEEAAAKGAPFWHHFQHLVLHGFLHLLGFDHEDPQDAETMESLEIRLLASAHIPNPYATP